MKYGVQLFGASKDFRKDTNEFFDRMNKAGITVIEPCILFDDAEEFKAKAANPFAKALPDLLWQPHEAKTFKAVLDEKGMSLESAHYFGSDIKGHIELMIKTAEESGITAYVFNIRGDAMDDIDAFCDTLTYTAAELKKAGIECWLHNGGEDFVNKVEGMPIYEYVLTHTEGVYAQVDTGWVLAGGYDYIEFIKKHYHKVKGIHIKEMHKDYKNREGFERFAVLGEGVTDIKAIFELAEGRSIVIDQDMSFGDFIVDLENSAAALKANEN